MRAAVGLENRLAPSCWFQSELSVVDCLQEAAKNVGEGNRHCSSARLDLQMVDSSIRAKIDTWISQNS